MIAEVSNINDSEHKVDGIELELQIEQELQLNPRFVLFAAANEIWANEMMHHVEFDPKYIVESSELINYLLDKQNPRPAGFYHQMLPHFVAYKKGYGQKEMLGNTLTETKLLFGRCFVYSQDNDKFIQELSTGRPENLKDFILLKYRYLFKEAEFRDNGLFHDFEEYLYFLRTCYKSIQEKYLN